MPISSPQLVDSLSPEQIADLRLAASKMTGATRRLFEAEMASNTVKAIRLGRKTSLAGTARRWR